MELYLINISFSACAVANSSATESSVVAGSTFTTSTIFSIARGTLWTISKRHQGDLRGLPAATAVDGAKRRWVDRLLQRAAHLSVLTRHLPAHPARRPPWPAEADRARAGEIVGLCPPPVPPQSRAASSSRETGRGLLLAR